MKNNISITPYIETARATLLVDFCVLGLGITFTTYEFVKKEIAENNLFILDVKPYIPKRSFGFATRNEPKSQILNEFISTVQNEINNL